ncbi:MAG: hypothetical protein GYA34_16120 [Chloroflexi bacterium]|nr:hypothetical protein [Chloroflexota bacterium]
MENARRFLRYCSPRSQLTLFSNLFFLWIIYYFGLGGWDNTCQLLFYYGAVPWIILLTVCTLVFFKSDYRIDLPVFVAAVALGYWGEWWGTTRGIWSYWNHATPPLYLPPLWGIGVITVIHFKEMIFPWSDRNIPQQLWKIGSLSFILLPVTSFIHSRHLLAAINWSDKLDFHFYAGIITGAFLILYEMNWKETMLLYLCGTLLGGMYEYLGTSWGEWTYITGETPPLWIAPLWGYATVAMFKLPLLIVDRVKELANQKKPDSFQRF